MSSLRDKSQEIPDYAFAQNRRLARSINFAHVLDELQLSDGRSWTDPRYFQVCKEAGFTAVRLPVQWIEHASRSAPYRLDEGYLRRVEWAVEQATRRHLAIVLNNILDPELMAEPERYKDRFLSIAGQVASRFRDAPEEVMLEPMAEPHRNLDPLWNEYLRLVISVIRESSPTRTLVVGPPFFNSPLRLGELALPEEDRNLIVSIHNYYPFQFTMQGERWLEKYDSSLSPMSWVGTKWEGTAQERMEFEQGFGAVKKWADENRRPIFMSEFGTSEHADQQSRIRWTRVNRELAERCGFSWGYWSFAKSFGLYELEDGWNEELPSALMREQ
jgi:endoglucanase